MENGYTYFVEDGQFSFQTMEGKLYGKVGDVIPLGPDGMDEFSETYILGIEEENVFCIGSVHNTLPTSEEGAEWWRNQLGIGRASYQREFEVFYRSEGDAWATEGEMNEVISADSEIEVRKIFDESHTKCIIERVVVLA